jgi:hypothetical protein
MTTAAASLALLLAAAACTESEPTKPTVDAPAKRIIGSWVIDQSAQKQEIERVSPSETETFDETFEINFASIRETFHSDGRYEVASPLGGPFDDRWELVSEDASSVTVRSSGHSWVARRATMDMNEHQLSPSVLTYTFRDSDHMVVTSRITLFGEETEVSYFFVRDE